MRFGRVLEIGCGPGSLSRTFAGNYFCGSIDAFDLSPENIRLARKKAAEEGLRNINYYIGDANTLELPAGKYDLIMVSQSLHHILNLENLFSQIEQGLTPGGLFWADDYCGPNRMQWTEKQLYYINEILRILPDKYKVRGDNGREKRSAERIPIEAFLKNDPSEGVRALDILPIARNFLDLRETVFWGGSILYELLLYIVHNFDEKDPADRALLEIIFFMEHRLIAEGVLESNFVAFTGTRRARKE
jgi:SAM-dependent methyltransferase